jgi:hypothetical protein
MPTITSLSALAKTSVGANDFLLIANSSVPTNYKFLASDFFPSLSTLGTTSESLFVSITNKNVLNFKGIKSLTNLLTVATASNNITLQVNPANIDLSTCNNTTSGFLSTVALATNVSGTLPVANGGTGATTLTANSILLGAGTSAFTALGAATNGQIPIGRTGLGPLLATLTAGSNVTITNGSGSITIAATLSTFTADVNGGGFVLYNLGSLNESGTAGRGQTFNGSDQAFFSSVGATPFYSGDVNIDNDLYLNGSNSQVIQMTDSAVPRPLRIVGSSATAAGNGADVSMAAGASLGANMGGSVNLYAGAHDGSGTSGDINFYGVNATPASQLAMKIVGTSKRVGINDSAPDTMLHVTQSDASANLPPLTLEQLDTGESFINFVGTSGAASANSISSSTGTAGSKNGAIRIKVNGTDYWIRLYATGE